MQTFLPYPDFERSARVLDYRRLGKQRVEALQILRALDAKAAGTGWSNHPATRMWRGYEHALVEYKRAMITEWVRRGYNNTMDIPLPNSGARMPPWLGDPAFHASHRSNLLRKDAGYYGQFDWSDPFDLEYVWPDPATYLRKATVASVVAGMRKRGEIATLD